MNSNIPEPETFCQLPARKSAPLKKSYFRKGGLFLSFFFFLLFFFFAVFGFKFSFGCPPIYSHQVPPPPEGAFIEFQIPQMMYGSNVLWNTIIVRAVLPAPSACPPLPSPPTFGIFFHECSHTNLVVAGWHTDHNPSSQPDSIPILTLQQQQNCRLLCKIRLSHCVRLRPSQLSSLGTLTQSVDGWQAGIKFWGKWGGGRTAGRVSRVWTGGLWTQLLLIIKNCGGGSWGWFCVTESWVSLSGIGIYFIFQLDKEDTYVG